MGPRVRPDRRALTRPYSRRGPAGRALLPSVFKQRRDCSGREGPLGDDQSSWVPRAAPNGVVARHETCSPASAVRGRLRTSVAVRLPGPLVWAGHVVFTRGSPTLRPRIRALSGTMTKIANAGNSSMGGEATDGAGATFMPSRGARHSDRAPDSQRIARVCRDFGEQPGPGGHAVSARQSL